MDFKLLDELVDGVGTLPQCGGLLPCSCLSIWICKYEVNIIIGVLEGLRTCWISCITHVLAALPIMYDRMNSIWLVLLGNSDPHRCMYRLHSTLKQSRSSCRPVNGVGTVIFRSLVVAGGRGRSTGGDWVCYNIPPAFFHTHPPRVSYH